MSVKFTSNKAAVLKKYNAALAAALETVGLLFTQMSIDEMDRLIYHAPPSASGYTRTGRLRSGQGHTVTKDGYAAEKTNNNLEMAAASA